jgi:hypothetical protein
MNRVPVLYVKEVETLSENLGFMIGLDPDALSGVQPAKASLQAGEEFFSRQAFTSARGIDAAPAAAILAIMATAGKISL